MRKLFAFLCALLLVACSSLPWTTQHTDTDSAGTTYIGEWKDGKANGQGTLQYTDGDTYIGEFKGNHFHGQGTYTYADGTVAFTGEWKDGKPAP